MLNVKSFKEWLADIEDDEERNDALVSLDVLNDKNENGFFFLKKQVLSLCYGAYKFKEDGKQDEHSAMRRVDKDFTDGFKKQLKAAGEILSFMEKNHRQIKVPYLWGVNHELWDQDIFLTNSKGNTKKTGNIVRVVLEAYKKSLESYRPYGSHGLIEGCLLYPDSRDQKKYNKSPEPTTMLMFGLIVLFRNWSNNTPVFCDGHKMPKPVYGKPNYSLVEKLVDMTFPDEKLISRSSSWVQNRINVFCRNNPDVQLLSWQDF